MVYVISKDGQPLMPTERYGKVRRLLKSGMAKVVRRTPFTIQLQYETATKITQPISLGVDAGSKHIGLSATTEKKVLYEADVEIRDDIVNLLASRRENRKGRRFRKTRHRKVRFDNRKKVKGGLVPSVRHKVECHINVIEKVYAILPVINLVVEIANFDQQKIKNPNINGIEYQQGEQAGFWNVREYVLYRDSHTCQCCKGKSGDKILNVHHIESRKTGGNAPNNLVTLCKTCHQQYHRGEIQLPKNIKRGISLKDSAHMNIMKNVLYETLCHLFCNISATFGYLTKHSRIQYKLPKVHYIDARCISGNPLAVSDGVVFKMKKIRCHNRQLHKQTILKGGYRKRNQAEYLVKGFRLFDKVKYQNQVCFIFGRRVKGGFVIRRLNSALVSGDVNYKKLRFLETRRSYLIEREMVWA